MSTDAFNSGIRGQILKIVTDGRLDLTEQRCKVAKCVVDELTKQGRFFYHSERHDFDSAMFFDSQAKRLQQIRSDEFAALLSESLCVNRADTLFRYILAEVETAALRGPKTSGILPEAYWARRPGRIYLSNGDGSMARIQASGIDIVDNGTDGIVFAAGKTLAAWKLTDPVDPFTACALFREPQCMAAHGQHLMRLFLYSLPMLPESKPPLCFTGAIGSGKTKVAMAFPALYGIPVIVSKVEERGEPDFWVNVDRGGILILDNADTRIKWLPDALATASTGGCLPRRKLYTDSESVVLRSRAWLIVTTANPTFASDAGLSDRLLPVRMNRREGNTEDAKLLDEIAANRDGMLSHIAQTLQAALADQGPVPGGLNARHPDFAAFAVRIGRALRRKLETIATLRAAEADKSAFCLENDSVAQALLGFLRQEHSFTGTAAELLEKLRGVDGDLFKLSAKSVGRRISALWPHLLTAIPTARREQNRTGVTVFTFTMP